MGLALFSALLGILVMCKHLKQVSFYALQCPTGKVDKDEDQGLAIEFNALRTTRQDSVSVCAYKHVIL